MPIGGVDLHRLVHVALRHLVFKVWPRDMQALACLEAALPVLLKRHEHFPEPLAAPSCRSFCFVGENGTIRWAVKRAKDTYTTEERGLLPLCWLFSTPSYSPTELSHFRPQSKMIYNQHTTNLLSSC